jgi:hypothetical protein
MGELKRGLEKAVCPKILFAKLMLTFHGNITSFEDKHTPLIQQLIVT